MSVPVILKRRLTTDSNGFALSRSRGPLRRARPFPKQGEDIHSRFFDSELGDQVLQRGAIAPVFPMTWCLRPTDRRGRSQRGFQRRESLRARHPVLVTGAGPAVLADMAVLLQWWPQLSRAGTLCRQSRGPITSPCRCTTMTMPTSRGNGVVATRDAATSDRDHAR